MDAALCNSIFDRCIADYHVSDNVDQPERNPFAEQGGSIEWLLYHKNWIDTVQWHLEDEIRHPELSGETIMQLKRRIDASNQRRTDTVERIDDWFLHWFLGAPRRPDARLNSETPAWLIDRLSILALKVYHWQQQTEREDVDIDHIERSRSSLEVLLEQRRDLSRCLDELIEDIRSGRRYMKVYRQMKMYNDEQLNPVLYNKTGASGF